MTKKVKIFSQEKVSLELEEAIDSVLKLHLGEDLDVTWYISERNSNFVLVDGITHTELGWLIIGINKALKHG